MRKSGMAFGGAEAAANIRTSSTVLLKRRKAEVAPVLSRITRLLNKPACHCEDLQVSRYKPGEFYRTHFDGPGKNERGWKEFNRCGGQRLATVLIYLNSVARGGETAFVLLNGLSEQRAPTKRVAPQRGRALVFFPGTVDGDIDNRLMHEALPPEQTKYVAQMWVRHGADTFGAFMDTHESI